MGETKATAKAEPAPEKPATTGGSTAPAAGRGVGSFLNGIKEEPQTTSVTAATKTVHLPATATPAALPKWPFVLADVLLVLASGGVLVLSPRPIPHTTLILATLGIIAGAAICLIPFMIARKPSTSTVEVEKPHPKLRITLH